jgi:hypothetical protein
MPEVTATCAGCGATLRSGYGSLLTKIRVGSGEAVVCPGRGRHSGGKQSCVEAARKKASRCPGCDKEHTEPGTLCEKCDEALAKHREAGKALGGIVTLVLDELGPSLYGTREYYKEGASVARLEQLSKFLAQACTLPGYLVRGRSSTRDFESVLPTPKVKKTGWSNEYSGVCATVTHEQADALRKFADGLRDVLRAQRMAGREEGRALLVGLASGKLTVNEWQEKDEQLTNAERLR